MFSDTNRLEIAGRLGRNPELKTVSNGQMMATFSIASRHLEQDELYGQREETTWLNVIAWGNEAKLASARLKKGDHVTLIGRLNIRQLKDEKAGTTRYFTQLILDSFQKNDRSNFKRQSGIGNGALRGEHPSQHTIADRFDNAVNPNFGEERKAY